KENPRRWTLELDANVHPPLARYGDDRVGLRPMIDLPRRRDIVERRRVLQRFCRSALPRPQENHLGELWRLGAKRQAEKARLRSRGHVVIDRPVLERNVARQSDAALDVDGSPPEIGLRSDAVRSLPIARRQRYADGLSLRSPARHHRGNCRYDMNRNAA